MSSSPTAPTSTTASSSNLPSRGVERGVAPPGQQSRGVERGVAPPGQQSPPLDVLACGALAGHVRDIVARRGWPVTVRSLPAVLHNRPQKIAILAERYLVSALGHGRVVALAYADCGTYGALDELCTRYGVRRLPGLHCYDVFAGGPRIAL